MILWRASHEQQSLTLRVISGGLIGLGLLTLTSYTVYVIDGDTVLCLDKYLSKQNMKFALIGKMVESF